LQKKINYIYNYYFLIFLCFIINFISCEEHKIENIEQPLKTQISFENLEQYPVTIYSDSKREIKIESIDAKKNKIIDFAPNLSGIAFYPTFHLDLFDIQEISIPYDAPFIITAIEENKLNRVPIPKIEALEINSSFIKVTNNSNYSLSLNRGNKELKPLGERPGIIMKDQTVVYEVIPGIISDYSFRHNTLTTVNFPVNLTEFKRGIIYTFIYNDTDLLLSSQTSVLQSIPPVAPENIEADAVSNSSVIITWNEVYGATSYQIFRATGSLTGTYEQIGTTSIPSYTDNTILIGKTYFYKICAAGSSTNIGVHSAPVSVNMSPSNLHVSSNTTVSITLNWNNFNSASGYNIYNSISENGDFTKLNTEIITASTFIDINLSPDTTYFYKISAVIGEFETLQSNPIPASTLSPIPVNFRQSDCSTINICLAWNKVNGSSGYNIYRSDTSTGIYTKVNTIVINELIFNDASVLPDATYYYKISTINNDIESEYSTYISISTLSSIPVNLRSISSTTILLNLAWNEIKGASGYNLYRSNTLDGIYLKVNEHILTNSTYSDTNVTPDTTYFYKVSSINNSAESTYSTPLSVSTLSSIPVNIRTSSVTTIRINLAWNELNGASGYNIYRSDTVNGIYIKLNQNTITSLVFTDMELSPDTTYYYKLASINKNIEGILSAPLTVSTLSAIPVNLHISSNSTSSISISWNIVSEASGYNVYRSSSENGTYTKLNSTPLNEKDFSNTELSSYATFYYKVSAIVEGIERDLSNPLAASSGTNVLGTNLSEKLAWVQGNAVSNCFYLIELSVNESIAGINFSYFNRNNITVMLRGTGATRVISIIGSTTVVNIGIGNTVILDNNISLVSGFSAPNRSLVRIENGTLIMNTGSIINGNRYYATDSSFSSSLTYGGGVYINGGELIMNGGEISGNCARYGSGVYIENGRFTMNGGKVSNNNSSEDRGYGGGVYINSGAVFTMTGGEISANGFTFATNNTSRGGGVYLSGGTFHMSGGVIYGSNASASLKNISNSGIAFYRGSGTAQYGTFNGSIFNSSGNLNTTDTTIRVVNGNLQTN